ncbi:hypothetical protein JJB09_22355 [Rhizobium sp. KVB221]|uniref:Uncharacterized protein n=1 Tax=Rhizobium setariae TaxID=2801340 RepID=A0A936YQ54_9HYPH|nr:hypothetical protein [Rhizobium setariae]MBL0374759.1 hypothetical protein [Rhizobium setariae]
MAHSPLSSVESTTYHAMPDPGHLQKAAFKAFAASPAIDSLAGCDNATSLWRTTSCSRNAFLHESLLDEMAASGNTDPLTLRRKLMAPYPVAMKLLDAIAVMSDWGTPLPMGRARGLTFILTSGTWIAEVAEVSLHETGIRIEKFFCAADAGYVADQRSYRTQMISDIVKGLSIATGRDIAFPGSVLEQIGRADLGSQRIYQCPEVEVELLSNSKRSEDDAEQATPQVIAALANAVSALTGKRLHRAPLFEGVSFV